MIPVSINRNRRLFTAAAAEAEALSASSSTSAAAAATVECKIRARSMHVPLQIALRRYTSSGVPCPTTSIVGDLCSIMLVRRVRGSGTALRRCTEAVSTYRRGMVVAMTLSSRSRPNVPEPR